MNQSQPSCFSLKDSLQPIRSQARHLICPRPWTLSLPCPSAPYCPSLASSLDNGAANQSLSRTTNNPIANQEQYQTRVQTVLDRRLRPRFHSVLQHQPAYHLQKTTADGGSLHVTDNGIALPAWLRDSDFFHNHSHAIRLRSCSRRPILMHPRNEVIASTILALYCTLIDSSKRNRRIRRDGEKQRLS
ncbi:hypothetical protein LY76DRAFT_68019 [Colletotrichum caudatum]|nr:hypothetical protein LY76DRAFT_68019 [Colletotrichum caudatum]